MAALDIYVTAKANLRDNVKTLIAVFGGIAGVLLAGTPFSGFGALELWSLRFFTAAISLVGAAIFISISLRVLMKVLQPDLAYPDALRENYKLVDAPPDHQAELRALISEFKARKRELLPEKINSLEELEAAAKSAWDNFCDVASKTQSQVASTVARQAFDELFDAQSKINHWSAFTRLHFRVRQGVNIALWWGLVALAFIAAFSWAVSGPKDKSTVSPIVVNCGGGGCKQDPESAKTLPAIEPVLFETDKWNLSPDAFRVLGVARDFLRAHPDTGVLVFAYTDTQGGTKVNRRLASKRSEVVAQALIAEGGVSRSRIFGAELPETDLPVLTAQEVDHERNRAVQLVLIAIPKRP